MTQKLTIDEIKKRLIETHGDLVKIDESSYVSSNKKARFIDREHGIWWAQVKSVCNGRRHTKNKMCGKLSRLLSDQDINRRLRDKHGDMVCLAPNQSYINSHTKMKFIDIDFGEWMAMPYSVFAGHSHPERGLKKAMKKMRTSSIKKHWKTGDELVCVGTYEARVVDWLNQNQIEFDWQIPTQSIDDRTYYVDAFIKSGIHANKYIEIKGYWMNEISQIKWNFFHEKNPNSELWTIDVIERECQVI